MTRFEHLLKLAQKTGDTLIIHNEQGRDIVIMDVSMYEVLHDMLGHDDISSHSECDGCCGHDDIDFSDMTERDMLDKINQDIAVWREYQQEDERLNCAHSLEDDLLEHPPFDPFEEDFVHDSSWHKAGDILQDKKEEIISNFVEEENIDFGEKNSYYNHAQEYEKIVNSKEHQYDELGELGIKNTQKQDIPFVSHDNIDIKEEVPFDDEEPIFFEEPI